MRGESRPISRVLSWIIIHLGDASPHPSSNLPESVCGPQTATSARFPIWSCSGWGLPCHNCYQLRGALLPHHFTLTGPEGLGRYLFCGTFRRISPPRRYLAPCPVEPGLSSPACAAAIIWSTLASKVLLSMASCKLEWP